MLQRSALGDGGYQFGHPFARQDDGIPAVALSVGTILEEMENGQGQFPFLKI